MREIVSSNVGGEEQSQIMTNKGHSKNFEVSIGFIPILQRTVDYLGLHRNW